MCVGLCVQAQQALLAVQWPAGLEQGQQTGVPEMETPGSRKGSSEYTSKAVVPSCSLQGRLCCTAFLQMWLACGDAHVGCVGFLC